MNYYMQYKLLLQSELHIIIKEDTKTKINIIMT